MRARWSWVIASMCKVVFGSYGLLAKCEVKMDLDQTSIYYMASGAIFLVGHGGQSQVGNIASSCLLG